MYQITKRRFACYTLFGGFAIFTFVARAADTNESELIIQDITSRVEIAASGFRRDLRTGELVQRISVKNAGTEVYEGALELVLEELHSGLNVDEPGAKAYPLTSQRNKSRGLSAFAPGQSRFVIVRFSDSVPKRLSYKPHVTLKKIKD